MGTGIFPAGKKLVSITVSEQVGLGFTYRPSCKIYETFMQCSCTCTHSLSMPFMHISLRPKPKALAQPNYLHQQTCIILRYNTTHRYIYYCTVGFSGRLPRASCFALFSRLIIIYNYHVHSSTNNHLVGYRALHVQALINNMSTPSTPRNTILLSSNQDHCTALELNQATPTICGSRSR